MSLVLEGLTGYTHECLLSNGLGQAIKGSQSSRLRFSLDIRRTRYNDNRTTQIPFSNLPEYINSRMGAESNICDYQINVGIGNRLQHSFFAVSTSCPWLDR